jgi:hypothetical protein
MAVMSGTVADQTTELYPYMKFIGAQWADDHETFKKKYGEIEDVCQSERHLGQVHVHAGSVN